MLSFVTVHVCKNISEHRMSHAYEFKLTVCMDVTLVLIIVGIIRIATMGGMNSKFKRRLFTGARHINVTIFGGIRACAMHIT